MEGARVQTEELQEGRLKAPSSRRTTSGFTRGWRDRGEEEDGGVRSGTRGGMRGGAVLGMPMQCRN